MATQNNNKMAWIRNIDKLSKSSKGSYYYEYEIATECHIGGVLNYRSGKIMCGGYSMEKDKNGLYHYLLRIKYPKYDSNYNDKADKKGYYFKDGMLGELLSLFSLFFQCRFYLISTSHGELTSRGLRIKIEHDFIYKPTNKVVHPKIFSNSGRNFTGKLSEFLNLIKRLDEKKHQNFILACYHYTKALKEVGIDSEMVFIRLVSAIEALSKYYKLNKKDNPLDGKNFKDLFGSSSMITEQESQLKEILKVSSGGLIQIEKSKRKFIEFICENSKGCLRGGNWKAKCLKIIRKELPKIIATIYDARSNYLHNGEPMFLSQFMSNPREWDTDPSLGMIIDNRKFPASQKLPYTYWFENIVRCCLINYSK